MTTTTVTTTVTSGTYIATGCKTNFYLSATGIITTWNFSGNSCVSSQKVETPDGVPPSNINEEQIKQLKSLLKTGVMSQEEYDEAVNAIKLLK